MISHAIPAIVPPIPPPALRAMLGAEPASDVDEYTAADRDHAAWICDALAADCAVIAADTDDAALEAGISLGASAAAVSLATRAVLEVPALDNDTDEPLSAVDAWAEAGAWIRSGWSPGDDFAEDEDTWAEFAAAA